MTNIFDNDVQGIGVYLELRKAGATCQVLVTPDGFSETDGIVSAVFFRRVISAGVSKKKWRAYTLVMPAQNEKLLVDGDTLSDKEALELTALRFKTLYDYFDSLVRGGYQLVNDRPIYVEVTKDDLSSVRTGTLPNKLWTRVKSSRSALGFPETITD